MSFQLRRDWIVGLLFCLAAVVLAGCPASVEEERTTEPAAKPVAKNPHQSPPAEKTDEQPAVEKSAGQQPPEVPEEPAPVKADPYAVPDGTPAELVEYVRGLMRQRPPNAEARQKAIDGMMEAADRILAGKPTEDQAEVAVQVKRMFLETPEELEALAGELKDANLLELARQVRGAVLASRLRSAGGEPRREGEKTVEELIGEVKEYLAEGPLQQGDVGLAMTAGQAAEMTGNTELAADTYTSLSKLFTASDDENIAEMGRMMEGIVRRLTLVGKKMTVEGTILGGEPFDWSKYEGKVVLVDFWASWCSPCVREIPNMKETYELYHELGFEIVGISLDRSREQLEKFIEEQAIPWTIVYSEDAPSPTVAYYGVMGIPTMVLVGADGNVVSTRARGPQLRKELENLLGPVEEKDKEKEEPDPTE